jgi:hypothetical protein
VNGIVHSLKKEDTEEANYAIAGESLDVVLDPKKEAKLLAVVAAKWRLD